MEAGTGFEPATWSLIEYATDELKARSDYEAVGKTPRLTVVIPNFPV
jgi:hypothetical protein